MTASAEVLEKRSFQRQLLAWYDGNKRDLPWRGQRDPYRVWVSEIMLQQTRVAVVIGYYQKFLKRFPTVEALAAARQSSVLAAWSGLGYYRRARMLHAGAREVVKQCGGSFPRSAEQLSELPGIGRYTAAAIASIAFGEPVAVVDGNVERVLNRVHGTTISGQGMWRAAQDLLLPARPGDFNQAMMELGATVCLPRNAQCRSCPVRRHCNSRSGVEATPAKQRRRKNVLRYALHLRDERVLLLKRSSDCSLMPGMWELPEVEAEVMREGALLKLRHSITVTDYAVSVFTVSGGRPEGEYFTAAQIKRMPLTGLAAKILKRAAII